MRVFRFPRLKIRRLMLDEWSLHAKQQNCLAIHSLAV